MTANRHRRESGIAHLVIVLLVVLVAVLLIVATLQSQSKHGPGAAKPPTHARHVLDAVTVASMGAPAVASTSATNSVTGAVEAGSGIVLTSTGQVLTTNHDIANASSITARVGTRSYEARVLGYDVADDLALLQLSGAEGLPVASLAMSSRPVPGDPVVALGAGGSRQPAFVTELDATATSRDNDTTMTFDGLLATSAEAQPSAAGGPLVDADAKVVGMNMVAASGAFDQQARAPVGFATPIADAYAVAQQIASGHGGAHVHIGTRAVLGVVTAGSNGGAAVTSVAANGAAAPAGIRTGDTIVSIADTSVGSSDGLDAALDPYHPGDTVKVGWLNGANEFMFANVRLAAGPPL